MSTDVYNVALMLHLSHQAKIGAFEAFWIFFEDAKAPALLLD